MQYPNLFTPITLAGQEIKNRVFMAPMGVGNEDYYYGGRVSTNMIDYYEERAKGGAGLIISPFTAVDERYFAFTMGIYSRKILVGISRLVEALHVYDCKFLVQLAHFGGKSPRHYTYGRDPVAPSSIESIMYEDPPLEMSLEQIKETIGLFIQSAQWAKEIGCDGVELHGAHGYLINQFYSPHTNIRNDEYGGTTEKRLRFIHDIAKGIREYCGEDFIIGLKFSAHEHLPNGIDNEEAIRICKHLNDYAILDYIHVSGNSITIPSFKDCSYPEVPSNYNGQPLIPLAEMVKSVMKIPVIATSGINDPDYAEELIRENKTDIVALGRALAADPDWPNKALKNQHFKPCIKCNTCYERVMNQMTIKCSVNPYIGEEKRYENFKYQKANVLKKVVIIGAGPAGLEAAIAASDRGHDVVIIEKNSKIGGNLVLASVPEFKKDLTKLIKYYEASILERNIKLKISTEFNCNSVLLEKPDVVVIAVGSLPLIPSFVDIKDPNVFLAEDIMRAGDNDITGDSVAIIGAGSIGCETALFLALKNKKVFLFDCLDRDNILTEEANVNKLMLLTLLEKSNVELILNAIVHSTDKCQVKYELKSGETKTLNVDNVIIAVGYMADAKSASELKTHLFAEKPDLDIRLLGDCMKVGKIFDAVNKGAHLVWNL